jgi:hypothetical protein
MRSPTWRVSAVRADGDDLPRDEAAEEVAVGARGFQLGLPGAAGERRGEDGGRDGAVVHALKRGDGMVGRHRRLRGCAKNTDNASRLQAHW